MIYVEASYGFPLFGDLFPCGFPWFRQKLSTLLLAIGQFYFIMKERSQIFSFGKLPVMLWWIIGLSASVRALLAWWLELGNDEVYYWTYALFPDLSHFDHPPMVGWMIQLFSLNLMFDNELFIRLSSVVLMSANTWIIFHIGRVLRNERSGILAALLYSASVYAFVLTGIFILPDTPQNFFWLVSLYLLIQLSHAEPGKQDFALLWIGFGVAAGLGMLSKYTSVFLWFGAILFVVFRRFGWLRLPWIWVGALISLLVFSPVILWNVQNNFISFSFHGARVAPQTELRPDYFVRELAGQWLYNNPVNVFLIWSALAAFLRHKLAFSDKERLLLFVGLPPILLFLIIALFRATLPHWTGPAYVSLIPLAALWLDDRSSKPLVPKVVWSALVLLVAILTLGALHIKFGRIKPAKDQAYHRIGKDDPSLDMYGYRDLLPLFKQVRQKHLDAGSMTSEAGMVGENWFPLANYDYYIANPLKINAYGLGKPERLHKYIWINRQRGGLKLGGDYWYITNSRDYKDPAEVYGDLFSEIIAADTLTVYRSGLPAKRHFVFILKQLQRLPPDPLGQK